MFLVNINQKKLPKPKVAREAYDPIPFLFPEEPAEARIFKSFTKSTFHQFSLAMLYAALAEVNTPDLLFCPNTEDKSRLTDAVTNNFESYPQSKKAPYDKIVFSNNEVEVASGSAATDCTEKSGFENPILVRE